LNTDSNSAVALFDDGRTGKLLGSGNDLAGPTRRARLTRRRLLFIVALYSLAQLNWRRGSETSPLCTGSKILRSSAQSRPIAGNFAGALVQSLGLRISRKPLALVMVKTKRRGLPVPWSEITENGIFGEGTTASSRSFCWHGVRRRCSRPNSQCAGRAAHPRPCHFYTVCRRNTDRRRIQAVGSLMRLKRAF